MTDPKATKEQAAETVCVAVNRLLAFLPPAPWAKHSPAMDAYRETKTALDTWKTAEKRARWAESRPAGRTP